MLASWVMMFVGSALAAGLGEGRQADQQALAAFAGWVGDWEGVGQPRRGSARDNWREQVAWEWSLTPKSASLRADAPEGKYWKEARLSRGEAPGSFRLVLILPDGKERRFEGTSPDPAKAPLVLTSPEGSATSPARITLRPLHADRSAILLEGRAPNGTFARIGEVGYTRKGASFAAGESGPVCIVTGGKGTIPVSREGKTYYVCCTGCKDLFESDPEGVLADYEESLKEKAQKGKP